MGATAPLCRDFFRYLRRFARSGRLDSRRRRSVVPPRGLECGQRDGNVAGADLLDFTGQPSSDRASGFGSLARATWRSMINPSSRRTTRGRRAASCAARRGRSGPAVAPLREERPALVLARRPSTLRSIREGETFDWMPAAGSTPLIVPHDSACTAVHDVAEEKPESALCVSSCTRRQARMSVPFARSFCKCDCGMRQPAASATGCGMHQLRASRVHHASRQARISRRSAGDA